MRICYNYIMEAKGWKANGSAIATSRQGCRCAVHGPGTLAGARL